MIRKGPWRRPRGPYGDRDGGRPGRRADPGSARPGRRADHDSERPGRLADPDGGIGEPLENGAGEPLDDAASLGWVPLEDRTWRHPSELVLGGNAGPGAGGPDGPRRTSPTPGASSTVIHHSVGGPAFGGRRRSAAIALVGTGAAAAVFAGMALLNTASGPMATLRNQPTATTAAVLTTSPSPGAPAPASTRAVSEGLVALSATTAQGVRHGSGIAVATGGLIATTVDVVLGATKLVATEPSGHRERARLVAYDRRSGVALLRVPKAVPVPTFAGTRSLRPGTPAMVMAMDDGGASDAPAAARQRIGPGTRWTTALVQAAATPVRSGAAAGMTAIAASVPRWSPVAGEVLVSPDGVVIGMLDATSVPTGTSLTSTSTAASSPTTSTAASSPTATPPATFLPARLVTAVSEDLARWGRVRHGWLDVDAQDATTPSGNPAGALVVAVPRRGASSGLLGAGDVIEAVEGAPVTSMAQLRERLYVLPAGTQVELEITRHGTQTSAEVDLGSSP